MNSESGQRLSVEELKRLNQAPDPSIPATPPDTPTMQDWDDLLAALTALYRLESTCEVIFCGLLLGRPREELEELNTPELEKYRRATRPYFLSRSRQDYAWALLAEGDRAAAERARARFEAAAARSPHPGEIAGERRLLALADQAAHF